MPVSTMLIKHQFISHFTIQNFTVLVAEDQRTSRGSVHDSQQCLVHRVPSGPHPFKSSFHCMLLSIAGGSMTSVHDT